MDHVMHSQPEINTVTHLDISQRSQLRALTALQNIFQPHVPSKESSLYSIMLEKMTSKDNYEKKNIGNKDKSMELRLKEEDECIFWYGILYAIGSYMINAARSANINSNDMVINTPKKKCTKNTDGNSDFDIMYDHIITRLFCGYWILYTIAVNAENAKNNTQH